MRLSTAVLMFLLAAPVAALDAPELTEAQQLRLQNFTLRAALIRSQLAQLEQAYAQVQDSLQAYLVTLDREGYTLSQQADGTWHYVEKPSNQEP